MGFHHGTYTGLGKQMLEGTNKTLYAPGPRRKEQGPHKRPDLPASVQESRAETWAGSGLLQARGTECGSECRGPFEGGRHYLHYLHHSLVSGQTTGREQPCPSIENWIKDLLSMIPLIRTSPSFPHSQSLPSGSFHKPLILISQRAERITLCDPGQILLPLCDSFLICKMGLRATVGTLTLILTVPPPVLIR